MISASKSTLCLKNLKIYLFYQMCKKVFKKNFCGLQQQQQQQQRINNEVKSFIEWGTFYPFIANFLATLNIGGAKELVVLL